MNRSIFGPVVFNSAAPDDGNMIVLDKVGTEAQKDRWLQPIIDGRVRSSIAMTEPAPGAGSDPLMMLHDARRARATRWIVHGAQVVHHRRRSRAALHPARAHVRRRAARPHGVHVRRATSRAGASCGAFRSWVPRSTAATASSLRRPRDPRREPAARRRRRAQGHADPPRHRAADALHALARARAPRARDRASTGSSGASPAARSWPTREGVRWLLADAATDLQIGPPARDARRVEARPGRLCAQGRSRWPRCTSPTRCTRRSTRRSSCCGARGYSKDTPLEWMYRYARQARLVDGASEVHRNVVASLLLKERDSFWAR